MDLYNKALPVDWSDRDQKDDGNAAIQYKLMEADVPHDYIWSNQKMKSIEKAVRALEAFVSSDEASDFVKELESKGFTMELDNLEFWETNL